MSSQELADAINRHLDKPVDDKDIGKLERGKIRWPQPERRAALRTVLGVGDDAEIGLYITRAPQSAVAVSGRTPGHADDLDAPAADRDDDVLLPIVVNGHSVMLPLEAVAAAARTSTTGGVLTGRPAADRVRRSLAATTSMRDERAYELFLRGYGLLGANDRGEIETAQALLDRAVNRDPRFARAIAARGYTSWRQYFAGWTTHSQALASALRDVDAALDVDPDSVFAHMTFIRACWDTGWHERALEAGRSIYERNPDSLDATVAFARALNNAGLAQYALPLVGSVLTVDPTNPAALKLNVWCHLMVGNYSHVLEIAREYLLKHPADANTRWAVALASQNVAGGGPEAVRFAQDAVEADPGDVTLWVLLGYLHRLNGSETSAGEAWSKGLSRIQADVQGVSNLRMRAWLANLHAGLGDVKSALAAVDELGEADPQNGYLRYRLSHVLAEIGHVDAAVRMLHLAVTNGFLSAQLVRQEEVLALARLRDADGYMEVMRGLDATVEQSRRTYAAHLPAAAVAPRNVRGGDPR
jgi:tetratricopeptide (TPR) repeat protein